MAALFLCKNKPVFVTNYLVVITEIINANVIPQL